jgi:hypothetical protein
MDELKIYIDLKPLSDDDIKANSFALSDLWMVKGQDNKIFGPFDTVGLRDYAQKHQDLFDETSVYNLESEKWFATFSSGYFQRRKPSLVSAQNLIKNNEFYLLFNGQKDGPHTKDKIQELLDEGSILPSSQISLDSGHSWIKIYEHHSFDRRSQKTNQELPFVPAKDVLEKISKTKSKVIATKETEDAIVGLAFIGHGNDKGQTIPTDADAEQDNIENLHDTNTHYKYSTAKKISAGVFLSLTVGIISFYQLNKSDIKEFKAAIREAKTSKPGINNRQRAARKPASVNKFVNKRKKYKPITKIKRIQPKRFKKPTNRFVETHKKDIFKEEIETLDINDPEVQEELTRQLAGEYNELDGEDSDSRDQDLLDEEEEIFDDNERLEHNSDDY